MEDLLKKAYSPESFRTTAHQTVDLLADYLAKVQDGQSMPVMQWKEPDEQFDYWKNYDNKKGGTTGFFSDLVKQSIHVHHPKYMGHQVAAPAPLTAISALVSALLNNGMAVYEMGPVSSALEKWVVQQFVKQMGFSNEADGLLTSGGTLATLTALLAARQWSTNRKSWDEGTKNEYAVLVSEQSHYCVDRAVRIMGFGEDGAIKIPVGSNFQMKTSLLEEKLAEAKKKGKKVIAVVGNACSTATGTYDDLDAIGRFAHKNKLWFHVDAAHGGAAIFSEKYKSLLKGSEVADSLIIDLHKMLMNPALATLLLFKNGSDSYATFSQKAQYLWEKSDEPEWFNYAKRTFECTKLMMSVKFFSLVQAYGFQLFDQNVTTLYNLGTTFAGMIRFRPRFELAMQPMSNIVCFRVRANDDKTGNELNSRIRRAILEEGTFYIVQTQLNGNIYLRVTLMNPFTSKQHLGELLDKIEELGEDI